MLEQNKRRIEELESYKIKFLDDGNLTKYYHCREVIDLIKSAENGNARFTKKGIFINVVTPALLGLSYSYTNLIHCKNTYDLHEFEIIDLNELIFAIEYD